MHYIPCNRVLLAQETLFLSQKSTFLPKDVQKVRKSRQILIVCVFFQSNTSQLAIILWTDEHLSTSHEIFWNLELWHRSLLILQEIAISDHLSFDQHRCWLKLLRSEMAISHWLHWKYLESGQRACGGDRCQRLSCNKFHRQTGRGHHCAASQVSRGISRLGIYSTWEQTRELQTGWDTTELPQMFLRSSNQNC